MYLDQGPAPGTPEFGTQAAYRKAILQGVIPSSTPYEVFRAAAQGDVEAGTEEFSVRAMLRRAGIAAMTTPETSAPAWWVLPARDVGAAAAAAKRALTPTFTFLLIGVGAVLAMRVFGGRRR